MGMLRFRGDYRECAGFSSENLLSTLKGVIFRFLLEARQGSPESRGVPASESRPSTSKAIVLCVEGEKYLRAFEKTFLPGIRSFGHRHGYDVILALGDWVRGKLRNDPGRAALSTAPASWLKIFALESVLQLHYRHVLYIDADVFISETAADYFPLLPSEVVSAIIEETIPKAKIQLWRKACGLAEDPNAVMVNAGVVYFSGDAGRRLITNVIARIESGASMIDFRNRVFEQPILSEFLLKDPAFKRMRYLYNTLLYSDRGYRRPEAQRTRSAVNRLCNRFPWLSRIRASGFTFLFALPCSYSRENRELLAELLAEGRFVHLAGMNDEQCLLRPFVKPCPRDAPAVKLLSDLC